ncbi:MAG TPA: hypothetical protein PLE48_01110 [Thiobacillus sp.]|nr:MAG: hypothetical protein B7Y50_01230 [Hydrogenophilales bacterium 28-61-11]OYZ58929.1 MAG: hypothetical protein B7Y21_01160 [Hydrogenophilales bacterium 16-61-112]OZA46959.1 MAG: hypothetical protein B7X81_06005 [Hydrogenophilales bacterium 17-61-76]HQT30378.1 hypothetical protein [Thiobacillus sp.]HQT69010.1 hypothetical protein [Thiobacillus sp.]
MSVPVLLLALCLLLWGGVLLAFAAPLVARWREPVLRCPVLIIESDDWGAGSLAQAAALVRLSGLLKGVRDSHGRAAVMTLGVVLEVPDGARIAASGGEVYHALPLADARFDAVRQAMLAGIRAGVFVPQLHGQCHYWPEAVMAVAQTDGAVRDWLCAAEPAATEDLPSYLQSRWIDAGSLPSRALPVDAIQRAVAAEARAYQAVFGEQPQVAVATTFVWNEAVEAAWREAGVNVIITPGRRATCRNASGQPACVDARMLTGERSGAGQIYLVRDVYFEPALGHVPQRVVDGLQLRTLQGRGCLVETHRFNFLRAPEASCVALESALRQALAACPALRFTSPLELANALQARDAEWVETRLQPRLRAWRARLDEIPRFRRIAQLSGLALPLRLLGGAA